MGVCIQSYGDAVLANPQPATVEAGYDAGLTRVFAYDTHGHALEGLPSRHINTMGPGYIGGDWWETSKLGPHLDMSYGGYGIVRAKLCRAAHGVEADDVWQDPDTYVGRPYYDLIRFADNEGTLGPAACLRINTAFIAHTPEWVPDYPGEPDWFKALADAFQHAATGSGMVVFS